MKKDNKVIQKTKKTEKEKVRQENKTLLQQCEEFQKIVRKTGIVIVYTIVGLCLCISSIYQYGIQQFGDGTINYSEEAYNTIKLALEGSQSQQATEEAEKKEENETTGVEDKESQETANFDENGEIVKPCLIADVGLDIKRFRPYVTDYEIHTEGETTILEAWKTEGTFTAKVTVKIDESYRVIETVRNYEDKAQKVMLQVKKILPQK